MGLGIGLILLWIVPTIEKQKALFRAVWFTAFLGGFGRLVSIPVVGMPPVPIAVFTMIELIAVPFFILWQNRVAAESTGD